MKAEKANKIAARFIKMTAKKAASYACGAASIWSGGQPKEPVNLKSFLNEKK